MTVFTRNPSSAVVCGGNDHPHFADGWHDRERDRRSGVQYRAARERARLILLREPASTAVLFLLSGPRGLCDHELKGSVRVDGQEHPLSLNHDLWVIREFPLRSASQHSADLEVIFDLPEAPCPDDRLHNGDGRRLGWFLAAAWQREQGS